MAPISNPRVIYNSVPCGEPIVGDNTVYDIANDIDLDEVSLNGGYLTKTLVLSPEPWIRIRMRHPSSDIGDVAPPMRLGSTFVSLGVAKVIRSEDPNFEKDDYLFGPLAWQAYTLQPWEEMRPGKAGDYPNYTTDIEGLPLQKIHKPQGLGLRATIGILGVPGQTAYFGLKEFGDMKQGETIYISAAAGAVGHLVVQFAKLAGLKVIASTGSDEKVQYLMKDLGADYAFNYKTTPVKEALAKHGDIDIYWDNVGGSTLEAAIDRCRKDARIIACGYLSEYNSSQAYGIKNLIWIFKKRIHIHGFSFIDLMPKWMPSFLDEVPKLMMEGKLRPKETIFYGLENADKAFLEMFQGKSCGKCVVVVAEDD